MINQKNHKIKFQEKKRISTKYNGFTRNIQTYLQNMWSHFVETGSLINSRLEE
jgi:hypothetical protein